MPAREQHSTDRTICLLLLGLLLVYMTPDLARMSLALDGLVYANIAVLLGEGVGAFWALPFYESPDIIFRDHPPLGMTLLSYWMHIFGTQFWVEKSYSLMMSMLLITVMLRLHQLRPTSEDHATCCDEHTPTRPWLTLFIFCLMPVATHTMKNNYLELPLTLFTLAAVLALWHAWRRPWLSAVAGLLVYLALLSKGPVGLLALATPLALWWLHKNFGRAVWLGLLTVFTLGLLLAATFLLQPDAADAVDGYWQTQVLASITGTRPAEHSRWYLLQQLGMNGGIALAATALITLCAGGRWRPTRMAGFWLILALAATLPLLLSGRQYKHYLFPALPFVALTLANLVVLDKLPGWITRAALPAGIATVAVAALLTAGYWGQPGSDRSRLQAAAKIHQQLAAAQTTALYYCPTSPSLRLRAYLFRHYGQRSTNVSTTKPGAGPSLLICAQPAGEHQQLLTPLHKNLKLYSNGPV